MNKTKEELQEQRYKTFCQMHELAMIPFAHLNISTVRNDDGPYMENLSARVSLLKESGTKMGLMLKCDGEGEPVEIWTPWGAWKPWGIFHGSQRQFEVYKRNMANQISMRPIDASGTVYAIDLIRGSIVNSPIPLEAGFHTSSLHSVFEWIAFTNRYRREYPKVKAEA